VQRRRLRRIGELCLKGESFEGCQLAGGKANSNACR
jgi:hypothetical protein